MAKTLSGGIFKGAVAGALAAAVSLATAAPSFAASHHYKKDPPQARSYYDVAPSPSAYSGGPAIRTNPAIVAPGGFGPPDPASCGGFHC